MSETRPAAFVATVSAYRTEADARAQMPPEATHLPYQGAWLMPTPERTAVHLFTQATAEILRDTGWITVGEATE